MFLAQLIWFQFPGCGSFCVNALRKNVRPLRNAVAEDYLGLTLLSMESVLLDFEHQFVEMGNLAPSLLHVM